MRCRHLGPHQQHCQPISRSCLAVKPGQSRWNLRRVRRSAAASDQKSPSEPMYLSDLIMFEVRQGPMPCQLLYSC